MPKKHQVLALYRLCEDKPQAYVNQKYNVFFHVPTPNELLLWSQSVHRATIVDPTKPGLR